MNAIVPQNFGAPSTVFAGHTNTANDEMSAGIERGFGIVGYPGKVWSLRFRGQEMKLMRPDGDGPRSSIEIVILKSSGHKSKIWYEKGYVEGSSEAPDCFSTNGVTPDMSSKKRQANACAACPMNARGSRITASGKPGKACQDSKRLAIVPLGDLRNEAFGGPMLLRVPAASLQALAMFADALKQMGYLYYGIGTRVQFDPKETYPKFVFSAIRQLNDEEARLVLQMRDDPQVSRILAEDGDGAVTQVAAPALTFEQPPQPAPQPVVQPAPVRTAEALAPTQTGFGPVAPAAAQPQPQVQPVAAPPTQVMQAPVVQPAPQGNFEADLDAQMEALLGK